MRIEKDQVDVVMDIPGATLRQKKNFGEAGAFGRISGEYFTLAKGVDTTPLFEGLEGGVCHAPHWGYVLRGRLTTTDTNGREETARANDLFYWPSGHNVKVEEDAEIVMFSPQDPHTEVLEHMKKKVNASA